jgi:eukaryotic-like serine/threonine-protein kinase
MSQVDADRNLLCGILAVQMDFVGRDELIEAMHAWVLAKEKPLGLVLRERGALSERDHDLLEMVVRRHLEKHGGDPRRSLAAAASPPRAIHEALSGVEDADVHATLAQIGTGAADPAATSPWAQHGRDLGPGRFRTLRPHARGGIGTVAVALDTELGREVALKEILPEFADEPASRARFVLEAEVTGRLEHPGVVPVYSLGRDPTGRPYYAMRFVRGDSLKEAIARIYPRDEPPVRDPAAWRTGVRGLLSRFVGVCNAVAYAHSRGVIHRDLKPSNILLGPYGETLVVDWGLAKVLGRDDGADGARAEAPLRPGSASGSSETVAGTAVGTPAFMSPEQAEGRLERVGPQSDVYSLGATLYAILTGRPPFAERDVSEALRRARRGEFATPRAVNHAAPPALEAICRKAMAFRPEDRYGTAKALAEDVERWLADEPVSAWREPWPDRARRWLGRHRTRVTAAAVAALGGLACLVAVLVVQARANLSLIASNQQLRDAVLREQAARRQAQSRFALALEAIKSNYTGASEDVLLKQPQFEALRARLLGRALEFYRTLQAALADDPDPKARADLADAYVGVARITSDIGSKPEALRAYEDARAIYRQLVAARGDERSRAGLADVLDQIGLLQEQAGRTGEALRSYREAQAIQEALVAGRPDAVDHRSGLAGTLSFIGALQNGSGQLAEALATLQRAVAESERAIRRAPDVDRYQVMLAHNLGDIGDLQAQLGRPDEAMGSYRRSLAVYERLAAGRDEPPPLRNERGRAQHRIALLHRLSGRIVEAMVSYQKAVAIRSALVQAEPAVSAYRAGLAETLFDLGVLEDLLGRPAEALRVYRETLSIRRKLADDNPSTTGYRRDVAVTLHGIAASQDRCGRPGEATAWYRQAVAESERAVRAAPTIAQYRLILARHHESLGEIQARAGCAAEALASYRRALALDDALAGDHPDVLQFRVPLANDLIRVAALLAATGAPAAASDHLRRAEQILATLPAIDLFQHYDLARAYALLSASAGRGDLANLAIDSLRRAIDAGMRDRRRLIEESDLDPLRSSPAFQDLLRDLAFPAVPFAP